MLLIERVFEVRFEQVSRETLVCVVGVGWANAVRNCPVSGRRRARVVIKCMPTNGREVHCECYCSKEEEEKRAIKWQNRDQESNRE